MIERQELTWVEILWPRPFELDHAYQLLTHLATTKRYSQLVFEARSKNSRIRYLFGIEPSQLKTIKAALQSEIPSTRFKTKVSRKPATFVRSIKTTRPHLALKEDGQLATIRTVLATLAQSKSSDEVILQVVLGKSHTPSLLPAKLPDPTASWLDIIRGTVAPASGDARKLLKERTDHHGFALVVRIGSSSKSQSLANSHLRGLYSGLKVMQSRGARLRAVSDKPNKLDTGSRPWVWPLRLSVKELVGFLAWPLGDEELSGVTGLHPKLLFLPDWFKSDSRSFAVTKDNKKLSISPKDSLEHCILTGPTGSGKSTAMLSLICEDINAGRAVLVIDPKADLINSVLKRIPKQRAKDVVILDPTDTHPVGFNPLAEKSHNPNLTADSILAALKAIFEDNWGIRSQDVLTAALLTLVRTDGATLVWLPTLLTNATFRRKITKQIIADDPIGLGAFWNGFEAMSEGMQAQLISSVQNKLRQFLMRQELRTVLGQTNPKFVLSDLFDKRKIVLVPLNKGVIGAESARLLGSLIVGQLWTLTLGRASLPSEKRHITNVYIDEVQDYLSLPTDLSDALSQARGLGVGLTLAHQYRAQLPPELRAGTDANARSKIIFGLNAFDAKDFAVMAEAEGLVAQDFVLLPRFGVYAYLQQNGKSAGWVSGETLPPPPAISCPSEIKAYSQAKYGQDVAEIEKQHLELFGLTNAPQERPAFGRKKRSKR